jgi:hypothetical protein
MKPIQTEVGNEPTMKEIRDAMIALDKRLHDEAERLRVEYGYTSFSLSCSLEYHARATSNLPYKVRDSVVGDLTYYRRSGDTAADGTPAGGYWETAVEFKFWRIGSRSEEAKWSLETPSYYYSLVQWPSESAIDTIGRAGEYGPARMRHHLDWWRDLPPKKQMENIRHMLSGE